VTLNRSLLNLSIMFVALSAVCMAQVSSGTISGSVRDSSGGAVVGAKVEITQLATTEKTANRNQRTRRIQRAIPARGRLLRCGLDEWF